MTFLAGQLLTAARLNGHAPQVQTAAGTSTTINSSSYIDITGATLSVTPTGANAFAFVTGYIDVSDTPTASNIVFEGGILVDGSLDTELLSDDRVSRATKSGRARINLAAGAHTIKLSAKRSATTTFTVNDAKITVELYDLP